MNERIIRYIFIFIGFAIVDYFYQKKWLWIGEMIMWNKYHAEVIAKRKLGIKDQEYKFCVYEVCGPDATILKGGIPKKITRGPRKGQDNWRGVKLDTAVVTENEIEMEMSDYTWKTGKCATCLGKGKVLCAWSQKSGNVYKPCVQCVEG